MTLCGPDLLAATDHPPSPHTLPETQVQGGCLQVLRCCFFTFQALVPRKNMGLPRSLLVIQGLGVHCILVDQSPVGVGTVQNMSNTWESAEI